MKIIFFVLLMGLIGCEKEITDIDGNIRKVESGFNIPNKWKLGEKIGESYFIVYDTSGKKWLAQQIDTGHGVNLIFSKME